VRVRAAVAATLDKGEVFRVVNLAGCVNAANRFGQEVRKVGHRDFRRNLRLRFFRRVNDVRLVLDERPFKALLGA